MTTDVSLESVDALIKGIAIPPRPTVLVEVDRELARGSPDMKRIASLVAKDVGTAAAMLKTINSPFFGLRSKVASVPQAIQLLGTSNVRTVVTSIVLRNALGGISLDRFWDASEKVAMIGALICSVVPTTPREAAYTMGLFRDCGIPILMQRFPEYKDVLKEAAGDSRPLTAIEDQRLGTHHATVGYVVARSWGLSDDICQAILHHHDWQSLEAEGSISALSRMLVAVSRLAEHLNDAVLRMRQDREWEMCGPVILSYLGLSESDYSDLCDDVTSLAA